MAYTKVGWKDYPDTTTPVNAANLNQMDKGIAENDANITTHSEEISQINTDLSSLNKSLDTTNSTVSSLSTTVSKKQDASTAITTSNISSQSVNYATSAGTCTQATNATYGLTHGGDFNIYIGNTATCKMRVTASNGVYTFSAAGLGVRAKDSSTSWAPVYASSFVQNSSRDFKENIEELTEDEAKKLLQLKPSTFDFKEEYGGKKGCYGLIAEEVEKVIPSVVTSMMGDKKGVDYVGFIPFLIKMVQMQNERITALEAKLDDIK